MSSIGMCTGGKKPPALISAAARPRAAITSSASGSGRSCRMGVYTPNFMREPFRGTGRWHFGCRTGRWPPRDRLRSRRPQDSPGPRVLLDRLAHEAARLSRTVLPGEHACGHDVAVAVAEVELAQRGEE